MLQELIEAEAIEETGAGRYERSEHHCTERDGHRPLLATQAGDLKLKIPKLRRRSEGARHGRVLELEALPSSESAQAAPGSVPPSGGD